jgi:Uma2 family endonuclease
MTVLERLSSGSTDRLGIDDFYRLYQVGAFAELGRVELLDGEIISLSPQARPHLRVKMALYNGLHSAISEAALPYEVFVEGTIALAEHDAPEPDVLVTNDPEGQGFVPGSSVPLVVEVADTTLRGDLGRKADLYARAGIAEYWVADVNGCVVHQMWSPSPDGYRERRAIAFGDPVVSVALTGVRVVIAA